MMMIKGCLSSLAVVSLLTAGCMDSMDAADETAEDVAATDDLAEAQAPLLANSVELPPNGFNTTCPQASTPRLVFFGVDAAGRESYTVQNVPAGTNNACQYNIGLQIARGKRARVKGAFLRGTVFGSRNTFVQFTFRPQLRTATGIPVVQSFSLNQSSASFNRFFPIAGAFNNCSRFPTPPETLFVSFQVTATGGLPGFPPSGSVSVDGAEISLEVESCTP